MIDFPASPTVNQIFTSAGCSWKWNGTNWVANTAAAILPASEAFAFAGLQINGDMRISQELGTAGRTVGGFALDGWLYSRAGTSATSAAQNLGVGGWASPNFLSITVTTAQVAMAATDYVEVQQSIEGFRCARLGWGTAQAQPVTISFWTAHHRTGIYTFSIRNGAGARSYVAAYTQNSADAWEYKTITIPGDTTGTWAVDNTAGLIIAFTMAAGSSYIASSSNAWLSGNYLAAAGQINAVAATTDVFRLANVLVLPGSVAPLQADQPFCFRQYAEELMLCRRYWQNYLQIIVSGYNNTGGTSYANMVLSPLMRATPTAIYSNIGYANASALATNALNSTHIRLQYVIGSTGPAYAVSDIALDARL